MDEKTKPLSQGEIREDMEFIELSIKIYERLKHRHETMDKQGRDVNQVLISKRATLKALQIQLDESHKD